MKAHRFMVPVIMLLVLTVGWVVINRREEARMTGTIGVDQINPQQTRKPTMAGEDARTVAPDATMTSNEASTHTESSAAEPWPDDSGGMAGLTGQVLLYPDDTPVAGATISVFPAVDSEQASPTSSTLTDAYGRFSFDSLKEGEVTIRVAGAGGEKLWLAPGESAWTLRSNLADGETTATTVRVFYGRTVSGLVFEKETSDTLAAAQVRLFADGEVVSTVTTNAAGEFRFERVPPRAKLELDATLAGYGLKSSNPYARKNGGREPVDQREQAALHQDIALSILVRLAARVENEAGQPIEDALFKWVDSDDLSGPIQRTDSEGRFEMELSSFTNGDLQGFAPGYAQYCTTEPLKLSDFAMEDFRIVLKKESLLTGRVLDMKGDPVENASFSYQTRWPLMISNSMLPAKSDQLGYFEVPLIPEGQRRILVTKEGYVPQSIAETFATGETVQREIRLDEELKISGRILNDNDEPLEAHISYRPQLNDWISTKSNTLGYFTIGQLPDEKVELQITAAVTRQTTNVMVQAGTEDAVIRFPSGTEKRKVKVIDIITRQPVEDLQVSNDWGIKWLPEEPGVFELEVQDGNARTVEITAPDYLTETVHLFANRKEVTIVELGKGGIVIGRVVRAADQKPLAGVRLTITNPHAMKSEAAVGVGVTEDDGRFMIAGIPAKDVMLQILPEAPLHPASQKITVKDSQDNDVGDIQIGMAGNIEGRIDYKCPRGPKDEPQQVYLEGLYISDTRGGKHAPIDATGHYSFTDIPPGDYQLSFCSITKTVTVPDGGTVRENFDRGTAGMTIHYSNLVGEKTHSLHLKNLSDGNVYANINLISDHHDPIGKVTLKDLPAGQYQLWDTEAQAFVGNSVEVRDGEAKDLRVEFP